MCVCVCVPVWKSPFGVVTERHAASCVYGSDERNIGDNLTMINSKYPSAFATVAGQHVSPVSSCSKLFIL